jgi:hypothetical protein
LRWCGARTRRRLIQSRPRLSSSGASTATGGSSWREGDLVFRPEHLKGTLVEFEYGNARRKPYRVVFNSSLDEHWYNDASMDKLSRIGSDDASSSTTRLPVASGFQTNGGH